MGQTGSTLCCGSGAAAVVAPQSTAPGHTTGKSILIHPVPFGAQQKPVVPHDQPAQAPPPPSQGWFGRGSTKVLRSDWSSDSGTSWASAQESLAEHWTPLEAALAHLQGAVASRGVPQQRSCSSTCRRKATKRQSKKKGAPKATGVWDPAAANAAQATRDATHTSILAELAAALTDALAPPAGTPHSDSRSPSGALPHTPPASPASPSSSSNRPLSSPSASAHPASSPPSPGSSPPSSSLLSSPSSPPYPPSPSPSPSASTASSQASSTTAHLLQRSCLLPYAVRELRAGSITDMTQRCQYYHTLLGVLCQLAGREATVGMLHLKFDGQSVASCVQGLANSAKQLKKLAQGSADTQPPVASSGAKKPAPEPAVQQELDTLLLVDLLLLLAEATAGGADSPDDTSNDMRQHSPTSSSSNASPSRHGGGSPGMKSSSSSSSSSSPCSSSASSYINTLRPLQVRYLPTFPSGHATPDATEPAGAPRARMVRVLREAAGLERLLPLSEGSSIFVAVSEERATLWKALIVGPVGTPYAGGCFLFDIYFPAQYPAQPPKVSFKTTGGGTVRFNPNLYSGGNVCLSLLGTWAGGQGEMWDPVASTVLQVLVSIQALILVDDPWFNEPGRERDRGSIAGKSSSQTHNKVLQEATVRWAMVEYLKAPPPEFAEVIRAHFRLRGTAICDQIRGWIKAGDKQYAARVGKLLAELQEQLKQLPGQ